MTVADIARALRGVVEADARAGAGAWLAAVQRATGCGTTCGACLPALKRQVQDAAALQPAGV